MNIKYLVLFATVFLFSCNDPNKKQTAQETETSQKHVESTKEDKVFDNDWEAISKDFMTWYNYTYNNIKLSEDFIGLDLKGNEIKKGDFLKNLLAENIVCYKVQIKNEQSVYQLFKLKSTDDNIKITMKSIAAEALKNYKMEGQDFPNFNLIDIEGKGYETANLKGKIIVLKCWFIGCKACVKEFPELNKLVEAYAHRKDILFVSLASDKKEALQKFLKTKTFKYSTVPEMEDFMVNKLKINSYPTHFLIDRNGKIVKVGGKIEELEPFLRKLSDEN